MRGVPGAAVVRGAVGGRMAQSDLDWVIEALNREADEEIKMAYLPEIKCGNPLCTRSKVSKWKDEPMVCEMCGAKFNTGRWILTCQQCKKHPEKLFGLFVPHLCVECFNGNIDHDKKIGNLCLICNYPRTVCSC